MKKLIALATLLALTGCATVQTKRPLTAQDERAKVVLLEAPCKYQPDEPRLKAAEITVDGADVPGCWADGVELGDASLIILFIADGRIAPIPKDRFQ